MGKVRRAPRSIPGGPREAGEAGNLVHCDTRGDGKCLSNETDESNFF